MSRFRNVIVETAFSGLSAAAESETFSKKVKNPKIRAVIEEIMSSVGFILKVAGWIITIGGIAGAALSAFALLFLKYGPETKEFLSIIASTNNGEEVIQGFHATLNRMLLISVGLLLVRLVFVFFPKRIRKPKIKS